MVVPAAAVLIEIARKARRRIRRRRKNLRVEVSLLVGFRVSTLEDIHKERCRPMGESNKGKRENNMIRPAQKITPFLWFDNQAEGAVNFYTSIFKNSKILKTTRYGETGPGPSGSDMTVEFELDGQRFIALNGGPQFKFTEAVSFVVNCESQKEVDDFWEKLSEGGRKIECGWLKDKYGLSWQVVPTILGELMNSGSPDKSQRVMRP
jgi:predicted 3-demethylubiquinone-9 3-methyltransferase (glyoxalase superfamily)